MLALQAQEFLNIDSQKQLSSRYELLRIRQIPSPPRPFFESQQIQKLLDSTPDEPGSLRPKVAREGLNRLCGLGKSSFGIARIDDPQALDAGKQREVLLQEGLKSLRSAGAWVEVSERNHRGERAVFTFRQPSHPDREPLTEVSWNCLHTRSRVTFCGQEDRRNGQLSGEEMVLVLFRAEPRDALLMQNKVERHDLRLDANRSSPAAVAVVRFADQAVKSVPAEMVDQHPFAGGFDPSVLPLEWFFDQRSRITPTTLTQELIVLPSQKIAAGEGDQVEKTCLTLGVAETLNRLDAVLVGHRERMPEVISRSSRTARPPLDWPPREYSLNPALALAAICDRL